jgi:hypothetical protein
LLLQGPEKSLLCLFHVLELLLHWLVGLHVLLRAVFGGSPGESLLGDRGLGRAAVQQLAAHAAAAGLHVGLVAADVTVHHHPCAFVHLHSVRWDLVSCWWSKLPNGLRWLLAGAALTMGHWILDHTMTGDVQTEI